MHSNGTVHTVVQSVRELQYSYSHDLRFRVRLILGWGYGYGIYLGLGSLELRLGLLRLGDDWGLVISKFCHTTIPYFSAVQLPLLLATRMCHRIGNKSVPIQLAQCWFPVKYTEAIL